LRPLDIGELVEVTDPRVAPDGLTIAFVVTKLDLDANQYRSRVWLAASDGSEPPRPFTAGEDRDTRPRWSPDGRSLAFVSHRDERGSELYVLPVAGGGELRKVASCPEEIEELAWSPDGERLAFTARERDEEQYRHEKDKDRPPRRIERLSYRFDGMGWTSDRPRQIFTVHAHGDAKPVAVTGGAFDHTGVAWSPDGHELAISAARHETWDLDRAVDLFAVAVDGGEPHRLTETGPSFRAPSWSPDGSRIAFVWGDPRSLPRSAQIGVIDRAGGAHRFISLALDRNCAPFLVGAREPVWDGDDLLFQVEDSGNLHLYRAAADGAGKPELLLGGDRWITGFDAAGGMVAVCVSTATATSELFVLRNDGERRLTRVGPTLPFVEPERFTATAPDGHEVEAWMMRPAERETGDRYAALLNIHGGPFGQYGNHLFDEFQIQAGAGYVVLYANPRGSSGYGDAAARAIRGPKAAEDPGSGWGGVDYDDVMAVVDEAIARFDFIDAERLGVLGGSYGGFLTSWIVGHTDRFRAACSERAVNDLRTMSWTSDIGTYFQKGYVGPSHLEDPDEYARQSPVTYVDNIHTPVLILHSENDLRCPIEQAEQLFVALRMLGREVEFVRFPGEGHELSRSGSPRHRVQRAEILLEFFGKHLRSDPPV
jgi:dipeptidyl aminopeptidase/acylaminoacyl peptidase